MPDRAFDLTEEIKLEGLVLLLDLMKQLAAQGGSDLHIHTNRVPYLRVHGEMVNNLAHTPTRKEIVESLVINMVALRGIEDDVDMDSFAKFLAQEMSVNFASSMRYADIDGMPDVRLRVNVSRDNNGLALVARILADNIRPLEELGFDDAVCENLRTQACAPHGLFLVTGPTGSGKTTTLAALINYINLTRAAHIITIEDPIEILYPQFHPAVEGSHIYKSLITQREVYVDTPTFRHGLDDSLRQDPNVILVGEIRTLETMEAALSAAETGHLVFATLHTNGGTQTINRMVGEFPEARHAFIHNQLANNLRCIISQRLLPSRQKKGRVLCYEYLQNTDTVRGAIAQKKVDSIPATAMQFPSVKWNNRLQTLLDEEKISEEIYQREHSNKQD